MKSILFGVPLICLLHSHLVVATPGTSFSLEGEWIGTCTPEDSSSECSTGDDSDSSAESMPSVSPENVETSVTPQGQGIPKPGGSKWEAHEEITCDGPLPPWKIPHVNQRASHELLIEVCADHGIGGDLYSNMGGRCYLDPMPPFVLLGKSLQPSLRGHRPTRLWCLLNCHCTYASTERKTVTINGVEYLKTRQFPNALVDMTNGGIVFFSYADSSYSSATSTYTLIPPQTLAPEPSDTVEGHVGESPLPNGVQPIDTTVVEPSIPVTTPKGGCDSRLRLVCGGLMPWWDLPDGFSIDHYNSLHHLCVSVHCGGSTNGNVGGVCDGHPTKPMPLFVRPFAAPALYNDGALRAYCAVKCWCATVGMKQDTRNRRTGDMVDIGNGYFINVAGYGLVRINANTGATTQLVASQLNDKDPWENRAAESVALSETQKAQRDDSAKIPTNTCGGACYGMVECSKSAFCMCLAAWKIGLDPVYPSGLCVRSHHRSIGGKRSLEVDEGSDYRCFCNRTYASKACCEQADGMVWETYESKLLSLQ